MEKKIENDSEPEMKKSPFQSTPCTADSFMALAGFEWGLLCLKFVSEK